MRDVASRLIADREGAVAATVALSLFALIAVGGVAFDYARMASLDTELQNAADQAALAGVSQLDGLPNACLRASTAARALITNRTLMANEAGSAREIAIPNEPACDATGSIKFYQDGLKTTAATSDSNAKFMEVSVTPRTAIYALTPIVAAFSSGPLNATAFAGLGSAICKTPPVMICNPQETGTNTNFDIASFIGKGIKNISVGNGSGTWVPGNFGYLQNLGGSNGAPGLREALGWNAPPGNCVKATGVDTKTGASVSVTDALNTRFDIFDSNVACPTGGTCPASINSVKDVVRGASANGNNSCKIHNSGWGLGTTYYGSGTMPNSATVAMPITSTPASMGHPRDMCHAVDPAVSGACTGPVGNGLWDRDAYFRVNYRRSNGSYWDSDQWKANTGLGTTATRYQVYEWEIAHIGQSIDGVTVLGPNPVGATGNTRVAYGQSVCSAGEGFPPISPTATTPDRRKLSVAVINCIAQGVSGNSTNVQVKEWLDIFLVEPSLNRARTNTGDIYIEVIGRTNNATDEGAVQLIKKSVPYLIE